MEADNLKKQLPRSELNQSKNQLRIQDIYGWLHVVSQTSKPTRGK